MLNYKIINHNKNVPCFVFIPGYTGTLDTWKVLVEQLEKSGNIAPILLIDNLGAGSSPQPSGVYTTMQMADGIVKVIQHLQLEKINLVGHSLGGLIAQQIALSNPRLINKLFLLATSIKFDEVTRLLITNRYELAIAEIDKTIIAKITIPTIFGNRFLSNPEKVRMAIDRTVNNPQTISGMYGQLQACLTHNTSEAVTNIACPTTIIHGANDILVSINHSQELAHLISNSQFYTIPDCGHMLQLEQPQQLVNILVN